MRYRIMPRQSISINAPNDEWLKAQLDSEEYASKSELVNDLIRQARRKDDEKQRVIDALIEGENSGLSSRTPDDIIAAVLKRRGLDGPV